MIVKVCLPGSDEIKSRWSMGVKKLFICPCWKWHMRLSRFSQNSFCSTGDHLSNNCRQVSCSSWNSYETWLLRLHTSCCCCFTALPTHSDFLFRLLSVSTKPNAGCWTLFKLDKLAFVIDKLARSDLIDGNEALFVLLAPSDWAMGPTVALPLLLVDVSVLLRELFVNMLVAKLAQSKATISDGINKNNYSTIIIKPKNKLFIFYICCWKLQLIISYVCLSNLAIFIIIIIIIIIYLSMQNININKKWIKLS